MKIPNIVSQLVAILTGVIAFAFLDSIVVSVVESLSFNVGRSFPATGALTLLTQFGVGIAFAIVWSVALYRRTRVSKTIVVDLVAFGAIAGISIWSYIVLVEYNPFLWDVQLTAAIFCWAVALGAFYYLSARFNEGWFTTIGGTLVVVSAALLVVANYFLYRNLYPTLHKSFVLVAFVSFLVGFHGVIAKRLATRSALIVAAVFIVASLTSGLFSPENANQKYRNYSEIGRTLPISSSILVSNAKVDPDPEGAKRFADVNGFPPLPQDFSIDDYNILLIGVEATRFDRTSWEKGYDTTPRIFEHARTGTVFTNAYSPSSGTLHSISSMMTMKFPSALQLTTWMKPWNGRLSSDETTIPELLKPLGFHTWWIGHNYDEAFTHGILGLDQGFDEVNRIAEYPSKRRRNTDKKIADQAIKKLKTLAAEPDKPFFGFIFFASPHGPYINHKFPGMKSKTKHDRYLQEIKNADREVGRVLDFVQSSKLGKKTVIIFFSDHGEEFREHGGNRHKSTVYTESIHVPLIIWYPGAPNKTIHRPTSTLYALPHFLVTTKNETLSKTLDQHLKQYLGPVLRDTGGAVVAELLGHDRIKSTLITEKYKLNFDYRSELFEFFDISKDRYEKKDLSSSDKHAKEYEKMLNQFQTFEKTRTAFFRHKFDAKRRTVKIKTKPKKKAKKASSTTDKVAPSKKK